MLTSAYICDAVRTPFGQYGGKLASMRADDLAAIPLAALMVRHPQIDWEQISDVIYGCAHQAGECGHNIARMASLLAGLPAAVSAVTCNRLCGSGMDAIGQAARAIKSGEVSMMVAGGAESMSRAPYVIAKQDGGVASDIQIVELTSSEYFINKVVLAQYGSISMSETAESLACELGIETHAQNRFASASRGRTWQAHEAGLLEEEITPVTLAHTQGEPLIVTADELTPRSSLDAASTGKDESGLSGTATGNNSAMPGDGACALLLANEKSAHKNNVVPKARVLGMATAGVPPRLTGIGPASAARKVLVQTGLVLDQIEVIELDEALAAQAIAVLRDWGLQDDDPRVNPNGGALALGHPLGACGARLVTTAIYQLHRIKGRYALCAMSIGVGQGIAIVIERV
jgi:3-oxoadipyl-CoA thiolase